MIGEVVNNAREQISFRQIEQGIEQGIHQGIEQVVINMLREGASIEFILKTAAISTEELNRIQAKLTEKTL